MFLLEVLIWVSIAAFAIGTASQVVIPGFKGEPLFPLFRPKRREIEELRARAREEAVIAELELERKRDEKRAERMRREVEEQEAIEVDELLRDLTKRN